MLRCGTSGSAQVDIGDTSGGIPIKARQPTVGRLAVVSIIMLLLVLTQDLPLAESTGIGLATERLANRAASVSSIPTAASASLSLQLLGQIGGTPGALATQGDDVYVGVGQRLITLDVSSPLNPVQVGPGIPLAGMINGISLIGSTLYVAMSIGQVSGGLAIVDVSSAADPILTGQTTIGGYGIKVAVVGNHAYVASYSGIRIVDISDQANPTEVSEYGAPLGFYGISAAKGYIFAVANQGDDNFRTLDISTPLTPIEVSSPPVGWYGAVDVTVSGQYAYVSDGSRLRVVSISNPNYPVLVSTLIVPYFTGKLWLAGNNVYLNAYTSIDVIDISNPANPAIAGTVNAFPSSTWEANAVVVGDWAYAVATDGNLHIISASGPSAYIEDGSYQLSAWLATGSVSKGNDVYVRDPSLKIDVVDLSQASAPNQISSIAMGFGSNDYALDIAVSGNNAYVLGNSSGLWTFDVTNPAKPNGQCHLSTAAGTHVAVAGSAAYVAPGSGNLMVVDASNPTNPIRVGYDQSAFPSGPSALAAGSGLVYGTASGLYLENVANPSSPVHLAANTQLGPAQNLAIANNCAYIGGNDGSLRVVDLASPSNPTLVGTYQPTSGNVAGVSVIGRTVYLADAVAGLVAIDASNPVNPTLIATYLLQSPPLGIAATTNSIVVADGPAGLLIFAPVATSGASSLPPTRAALTATTQVFLPLAPNLARTC